MDSAKKRGFEHPSTLRRILLYWVALWLSGILAYDYYARIEGPSIELRMALHNKILDGDAPYQYRYRILLPYAAEPLARLIQRSPIASSQPKVGAFPYGSRAFALAYCLLNTGALVALLCALGELVWQLFRFDLALFAIAASAMLIIFTFRDHYFHPWSFWEGAFFALGLLSIHRKSYWWFSAINVLGIANRETSVFLALAFFLVALPSRISKQDLISAFKSRAMRFATGGLVIWALGYFALHHVVGYKPATFFLETAINGNLAAWNYALVLNVILLGLIAPLVLRGIALSSPLIRRASMILPMYFALLIVIGFWWEIRYWITVVPIIIPAMIAAIAQSQDGPRSQCT